MLLVVPLGVLMGRPFPLGLTSMGAHGLDGHASVMLGVSSAASVFGAALAMITDIWRGFSSALFAGAAARGGITGLFVLMPNATRAGVTRRAARLRPIRA